MRTAAFMLLMLAMLPGCIGMGTPPGGADLSPRDALVDLERMAQHPCPLERPLVILNGYRSPSFLLGGLASRLAHATSGNTRDLLVINFIADSRFEAMVARTIEAVDARWPSDDPRNTVEVDVVGVSMGGLVARLAAIESPRTIGDDNDADNAPRALRVRRLFTLATPHQGASIARWIALDDAARDMRPGSAFLERLDTAPRGYELVCYAHLRDITVGATRAAPPGVMPIWTGGTLLFSHGATAQDVVIIADIARRIRGEPPLLVPDLPPPRN